MMNFMKWVSYQLASNKLLSARPFHFFDEELPHEELGNQGMVSGVCTEVAPHHSNTHTTEPPANPQPVIAETSHPARHDYDDKNADSLTKVEALQIKFLRLIHRLGLSTENLLVSQVLYRLQVACLIRAGESDEKRSGLKINRARAIAAAQEAACQPDIDFSLRILLLGKTGVGKSATINSIFDQPKAATNAFHRGTNHIQEVAGTIKGLKVTVIDTPGFLAPGTSPGENRKLMLSLKRFIKKSPPDVVLYFERLDVINRGYSDYPLLKLITDIFGSSIWLSTILVMTHCSSYPPEGPDGYPVSYDNFVHQCTMVVKHYVRQAASNSQLETPMVLVENHPMCRTNSRGEKVLPNGQVWLSQFLLLCIATKLLGDANSILKFQDSFQTEPSSSRLPSLPHLLSSILRPHSFFSSDEFDDDEDVDELSDGDEDEYDKLPPIRILTRTQFQKLSDAQRYAYLDELDYRETLYLKKQWKEELKRRRERMLPDNATSVSNGDYGDSASQETMQASDMAIPLTFDSGNPAYRFRCLFGNYPWLARPVLDPQGWDHDVGFDGINLEASQDVGRNLHLSLVGQMSKDKEDFTIQSECTARYKNVRGCSLLAALDVQTASKDLVCTIRGDAKFHNFKSNTTGCGLSVTKFGNFFIVGAKIEDSISVGRRFKLKLNTGQVRGCSQVANGGSIEATIRGKNHPFRDGKVILGTTIISFDKEMVFGGSVQSDFRVGRNSKMSVNANLNSRRLGQFSVKISTSDHVEITLLGIVSLFHAIFRRRPNDALADWREEGSVS